MPPPEAGAQPRTLQQTGASTRARYPACMPAPAPDNVLCPSQLNALARSLLEDAFPLVLVEGAICNMAQPASGPVYLTLKYARAPGRCSPSLPQSQWLRFLPRTGRQVLARGRR